jgi:hypothetical protein
MERKSAESDGSGTLAFHMEISGDKGFRCLGVDGDDLW